MKRSLAAALGLGLLLGGAVLGCPAKELTVEVTTDGIAVLGLACRNYEAACEEIKTKVVCNADLTCHWDLAEGGCRLADRCGRSGNPAAQIGAQKAIRVLLIGQNPAELKARSRCVPIVPAADPACQDPLDEARAACATQAMNQAIDAAIHAGLTYSGFDEATQAFPVIAMYQPATLPAGCENGVGDPACAKATFDCPVEELVSCAGLAVPLNRSTYDITCASCQNGLHFSVGVDTGPCPVVNGACFFDACAAALARAKSQPLP